MTSNAMNLALDAVRIKAQQDELRAALLLAREKVEKEIKDIAAAAGMVLKTENVCGILLRWEP